MVQFRQFLRRAAEPTKSEGDAGDFPASAYAYVPDPEKPSTWKLRMQAKPDGPMDSGMVGGCVAALGPGFRGQKVEIPESDLPAVKAKVRTAWKKLHPDAKPEEMPDAIKAAELLDMSQSMNTTMRLLGDAINEKWGKGTDGSMMLGCWLRDIVGDTAVFECEGETFMCQFSIDRTGEEPKVTLGDRTALRNAYVTAAEDGGPSREFLQKLRELLKAKVKDGDLSEADFADCVAKARAHAGGIIGSRKRKEGKKGDMADGDHGDADMGDGDEHMAKKGDMGDQDDHDADHKKGDMKDKGMMGAESGYRIAIELQEFMDPPDTIPFLPAPGTYTHPKWGEIKLTKKRLARFIENFKSGIYQKELPIDAEHQLQVSGAVGWVKDLVLNEAGGVDAAVQWTDRGKKLLEEDRFKFISPAWYEEWPDPADPDKVYQDVAIGCALTTRPFFKEPALRPLAAGERGEYEPEEGTGAANAPAVYFITLGDTTTQRGDADMAGEPKVVTMTEEEYAALKTASESAATEITALRKTTEEQAGALKTAAEQIGLMQKTNRLVRFASEVDGRTQESRVRWYGERQAHIDMLESLSQTFGEDSAQYKGYVANQRAVAEAIHKGGLFSEVGREGGGADGGEASAAEKLQRMASEIVARDKVAPAEAMSRVARENPALYEEYRKETQVRI